MSDVANAVLDGTDAVVLSEEVANGKYGAQAVAVMHRIISDIEDAPGHQPNWISAQLPAIKNEMDAVAYYAYRTAERIKAKRIVTITKAGNTALKLASYRPPIADHRGDLLTRCSGGSPSFAGSRRSWSSGPESRRGTAARQRSPRP